MNVWCVLQADAMLQQLAEMQLQDPGPSSGPPPWGPAVQPSLQPQAWQLFRYNVLNSFAETLLRINTGQS